MAKNYPYGKGKVKWVSSEWLEEHLDDENLMILDTQPDVHDYITGHIPGAVYMNEGLLRIPLKGLPAQYVSAEVMQELLSRIGLKSDVPVVVYTGKGPFSESGNGLEQTMMAYTLARFGHDNIYVLDGGINKWVEEDREITKKYADVTPSDFKATVHEDYFVDMEQVKEMKERDDVMLLDARPDWVYAGQGPWMKPGHIPGAINVPWPSFMVSGNPRLLKSDAEIQAILDEHDITPDKTIICSCGTGREATNEFILFKWYLGFPKVKIYEGSFTEWAAYPDNPVVTGDKPR